MRRKVGGMDRPGVQAAEIERLRAEVERLDRLVAEHYETALRQAIELERLRKNLS